MATLNPQQFHTLPMFLPAEDVIDTFHKGDAAQLSERRSPREQWEKPDPDFEEAFGPGTSLRAGKLIGVERRRTLGMDIEAGYRQHALPPLSVGFRRWPHDDTVLLTNGHHRLAVHEKINPRSEVPLRWY